MPRYQFSASDIYIPGTDIPKNHLGITESELLHEVEETLLQQAYQTFIAECEPGTRWAQEPLRGKSRPYKVIALFRNGAGNYLNMASPKYPLFIVEVATALKMRYRDFNHYNLKDPLDELLFIICSTKTGEASYRSTFRSLKETFPTHLHIAEAPAEYIARPIVSGGLSNQKAKAIRNLLDVIVEEFGEPTLKPLRKMSDEEAEAFLLSLPGVGKKVARCVLMYSLGRQVFPVDTHCWRIARRLGWVRPTQKDKHCAPRDMDRLQSKILPELRHSLHVNMISLGREICTPTAPRCDECTISAWCPRITAY